MLLWGIFFGVCKFLITRHTPPGSHQKMINLYSHIGGWPLEFISMILRRKKVVIGSYEIKNDYLRFDIDESKMKSLRQDGFIVNLDTFSKDELNNIVNYSRGLMGIPRAMDGDLSNHKKCKFDPEKKVSTRFDFEANDLINSSVIQNLISSPKLIFFLQEYLGGLPILTNINMWLSVPVNMEPDYEAAQEWHFDMDRPKWLKCFIYLTDVLEENGPHQFIKGSHAPFGIPLGLRKLGYVRLDDALVRNFYTDNLFISFTGNAGTMIVEDTNGLHRGRAPIDGSRLILAVEFSTTLFGASYKKIATPKMFTAQFKNMFDKNPKIYQILESK